MEQVTRTATATRADSAWFTALDLQVDPVNADHDLGIAQAIVRDFCPRETNVSFEKPEPILVLISHTAEQSKKKRHEGNNTHEKMGSVVWANKQERERERGVDDASTWFCLLEGDEG